MTDDDVLLIDPHRQRCLCDVGAPGFRVAVAVDADGEQHLLLADVDRIGDETALVNTSCPSASHDQLGPLPLEFTRRLTVSLRTHRCGRMTKSGAPCRIAVHRPGDACARHRTAGRIA